MTPPILGIFASAVTGGVTATSFESIATTTVGAGGASSVTFSSLPSGYTHLQIRAMGTATAGGGRQVLFRFNGDSGSNYNSHQLFGTGASALSDSTGTTTSGWFTYWDSGVGAAVFDILDYANTNKNKTTRSLGGFDLNGSGFILFRSGLWLNTSAITSITILPDSGNFGQYSSFALYGIKAAA